MTSRPVEARRIVNRIKYRRDVSAGAPQTDDALHAWLLQTTGYYVPRVPVVEGHKAPFQLIADFYFGRITDAVALAGRETGKTADTALLHLANGRWKPGHETIHFGSTGGQADRCNTEYARVLNSPEYDVPIPRHRGKQGGGREYISADGHVVCEILPGTLTQTQSGHPNLVSFDEAEQSHYQAFTNAKGMPSEYRVGDESSVGQFLTLSTRQYRSGRMQAILDEAQADGIPIYEWNVLTSMEPCDGKEGRHACNGWECPIALWCMGGTPPDGSDEAVEVPHACEDGHPHGRAVHADGYRSYQQILTVFNRNDRDTWEAQHLCIRPEASSLIYSTFRSATNAPSPDDVLYYAPGEGRLLLAYDFGWTDPTIIQFVQEMDGLRPDGTMGLAWYVFDEIVDNEHDGEWYAQRVVEKICALPDYVGPSPEDWARMKTDRMPWPKPGRWPEVWPAVVAGDPSAPQLRSALRAAGVGARGAKSTKHEVAQGQQVLRAFIASGGGRRLYVDPVACPVTVMAFERYGSKRLPDGSYGEMPDPSPANHVYSHPTDALRYLAWPNRRRFGVTVDRTEEGEDDDAMRAQT